MHDVRTVEQEAAEDVFFGQTVIIWARWFVIAAGALLVLTTVESGTAMAVSILPIVALMAMNFYLHGRYFMERPVTRALIVLTSLVDVAIISAVIVLWLAPRGSGSHFFVLYYPVLLAFAFVMPRRLTVGYTLIVLGAYIAAAFVGDLTSGLTNLFIFDMVELEKVVTRLVTLATVGALGSYYWRIQRERRRAAASPPAEPSGAHQGPAASAGAER